MKQEHYKQEMSGFVDGDLYPEEHDAVAKHLTDCEVCRSEHDMLKFGAAMLSHLQPADAPGSVWSKIEEKLDGQDASEMGLMPQAAWIDRRRGFAFAASLAVVSMVVAAVYFGLFAEQRSPIVFDPGSPAVSESELGSQETGPIQPANTTNSGSEANANRTDVSPPAQEPRQETVTLAAWQVETLAGSPMIGNGGRPGEIAVGQMLETDSRSRAKITVADIGSVEIAPNSRVKFVRTSVNEHRLALERGQLHAKIFAPPRLFVVDTPSGTAVDLGCEYTLQVDRVGNSILHVTGGFVALENGGRESIVPAGMMCMTMKGKGIGTPFAVEADPKFRKALEDLDFRGGGSGAVRILLDNADFYDMVTLWHLLSRVPKSDRGAIFDRLSQYVTPPAGVTREGVVALDKAMLSAWRIEVENLWFN